MQEMQLLKGLATTCKALERNEDDRTGHIMQKMSSMNKHKRGQVGEMDVLDWMKGIQTGKRDKKN